MSHRLEKIAETVQRELSSILLFDVQDARLQHLSITQVKVTPDVRLVKVFYIISATGQDKENVARRLAKAGRFIRFLLGQRVKFKFVPEVKFFYDDTYDVAQRIDELLEQIE